MRLNPPGEGNRFTDPYRLPRYTCIGNGTVQGLICTNGSYPGEAAFWTEWARRGVAVDSANAADSYKTLLNASGRGVLYGVMSQAIADAADVITARFTVDGGTPVPITITPGTVNYRGFFGYAANYEAFSTAYQFGGFSGTLDATKTWIDLSTTGSTMIADPIHLEMFGIGLAFKSSLLVEMKATTAQNGTANQERQSGVLYRMGL